ncbi:unnamed protein product [Didymodactylos carnosus]|nr:unnamed protein product [Didymodactylos carnosus]CAF4503032.1 unnamed protein product [Didymodactylos carnosus]
MLNLQVDVVQLLEDNAKRIMSQTERCCARIKYLGLSGNLLRHTAGFLISITSHIVTCKHPNQNDVFKIRTFYAKGTAEDLAVINEEAHQDLLLLKGTYVPDQYLKRHGPVVVTKRTNLGLGTRPI